MLSPDVVVAWCGAAWWRVADLDNSDSMEENEMTCFFFTLARACACVCPWRVQQRYHTPRPSHMHTLARVWLRQRTPSASHTRSRRRP